MLNDSFIFLNTVPSIRNPYHSKSRRSHYREGDWERDYSLNDYFADLAEQEQRRKYEAAMQQQAYQEAMRRRKQQRLLEEQRMQYLIELERQRHQQEREEQKRQYNALLEYERLEEKRREKARAAALEAKKRRQTLRNEARCTPRPMQQIVQMPDGGLYRIFVEPDDFDATCLKHESNLFHEESVPSLALKDNMQRREPKKNSLPLPKKKQLKSSVLVGDVEDASDSECEEEFNDYWHNRRPQPGKWIEPIERFAANI